MTKTIERIERRNRHVSFRTPTIEQPVAPKVPPIRTIERVPPTESEAPAPKRYVRWLGLIAVVVLIAGLATLAVRAAIQDDTATVDVAEQPWVPESRGLTAQADVFTVDLGQTPWLRTTRGLIAQPAVTVTVATPAATGQEPWSQVTRGLVILPEFGRPWAPEGRGLVQPAVTIVHWGESPWTADDYGLTSIPQLDLGQDPWTAEVRGLVPTPPQDLVQQPWTVDTRGLID